MATTASGQPRLKGGAYALDAAFDPTGQAVSRGGAAALRPGYVGQMTDARSLEVTSADVAEEGSTTMAAMATMDDGTATAVPADQVGWGIVSGPLTAVSTGGLVRSTAVYQDTPAGVRGSWSGLVDLGEFTVLNTDDDNVVPVEGDGIDDAWQFLYFDGDADGVLAGGEVVDAGPRADPDGDEQDNLFEFLSGHIPIDGDSLLDIRFVSITGGEVTIELSKVIPTTRYTLVGSADLGLADPWAEIGAPVSGVDQADFQFRHVGSVRYFYTVRLSAAP